MTSRTAALADSKHKATLMWTFVVAAALLALAGCRAEEQGRVLRYEAGVYKGKADSRLNDGQLRELNQRAAMQSGVDSSTGGAPQRNPDVVRPKQSETVDWKVLEKRIDNQKAEPVKPKAKK